MRFPKLQKSRKLYIVARATIRDSFHPIIDHGQVACAARRTPLSVYRLFHPWDKILTLHPKDFCCMAHDRGELERFTQIQASLKIFAQVRNWDQFHSPKNLVMALTSEIGELAEHFQWLSEDNSKNLSTETLDAVREEMADVQIYLLMLANKLNVDLLAAVEKKIEINASKYPIDKATGRSENTQNCEYEAS